MLLRRLNAPPERLTAVAMMLIAVGLGALVAGIVWQRYPLPRAHAGTDWDSFLHGFLMGVAIALEAGGVVLATVVARAKSISPSAVSRNHST